MKSNKKGWIIYSMYVQCDSMRCRYRNECFVWMLCDSFYLCKYEMNEKWNYNWNMDIYLICAGCHSSPPAATTSQNLSGILTRRPERVYTGDFKHEVDVACWLGVGWHRSCGWITSVVAIGGGSWAGEFGLSGKVSSVTNAALRRSIDIFTIRFRLCIAKYLGWRVMILYGPSYGGWSDFRTVSFLTNTCEQDESSFWMKIFGLACDDVVVGRSSDMTLLNSRKNWLSVRNFGFSTKNSPGSRSVVP